MNTLHEAFERRAGNVGAPDLDVDELVGLGEHRLRRRRLTAVLGATAAVVVAITIGVGIALNGPATQSQGPAHLPSTHVTKKADADEAPPTRQIVYSDHKIGVPGDTVHFGDRVVETGNDEVHLDVTDEGFLYTDSGGVWFSDGGTPDKVGSHLCGASRNGEFGHFANRAVMAANSGSTVAWFDCTHPARPTLVVFDTSSRHEVARRPTAFCKEGCELVDVTAESVYLNRGVYTGAPRPDYRFDLTVSRLRASTLQEYAEELRRNPRGLILGDAWRTGTPITGVGRSPAEDGALRFDVAGSRLVPQVTVNDRDQATSAFDTATRRALRLRLPSGYQVDTTADFGLFEWLDDDTLALRGGPDGQEAEGPDDLLTCQLSTGRCVVSVPSPDADTWRILPEFPLPG
jgi:hypothetical protein